MTAAAAAAPAPKRPRKQQLTARAEAETELRGNVGGAPPAGCCYLQLRSRRLFMPAAAGDVQCPVPPSHAAAAVQRSGRASGEQVEVVAGISRCSSTASSSVDVVLAPARESSGGCEDFCDVDSVVSDSAGCRRRERRETTPSSGPTPVDFSDEEEWSHQATDDDDDPKRHRRRMALAAATATSTAMPPAGEIEDFFGAAEKAQADRFAAKYSFDVARGLPLGAGRFEWTPVANG